MRQKPPLSYPMQFAILIGLMGVFMMISGVLVSTIGHYALNVSYKQVGSLLNKPENANLSRFVNTLASVMVFLLPSFILAKYLSTQPFRQLGFNTLAGSRQIIWLLLIMFSGIVLSGALGLVNEKIPLPADWYAKARELENEYKTSMMSMANMKTVGEYLISLVVLAVAPAFCEEILFRGGFQQVFIGWTKSNWAGIIITSVLFSAFHFSFFGFLPRVALGMLLGMVFFYSRNLWLSVLFHFLYNGLIVTQLYLSSLQGKPVEKTMEENLPLWMGAGGLLFVILFTRHFKKESALVLAAGERKTDTLPENNPS